MERIIEPRYSWHHGTLDLVHPYDPSEGSDYNHKSTVDCVGSDVRDCPIGHDVLRMLEAREYEGPDSKSSSITSPSLTPNLEYLTFKFGKSNTPPTSHLPFLTPALIALDLLYHVCPWKPWQIDDVVRLLFESLRALETSRSLPSLQRFGICVDNMDLTMAQGYEKINELVLGVLDKCPQIRSLQLSPFIQHEQLLLKIESFPQLMVIQVFFATPNDMISFAKGIAFTHPNLRVLELGHRGHASTPLGLFEPLLQLRQLVKFSIKTYSTTPIEFLDEEFSDDPPWYLSFKFLQALSKAWPTLECLQLSPSNDVDLRTLEGFRDSNLFPCLKELIVDVNNFTQSPPESTAVLAAARFIRPLRSLLSLRVRAPEPLFFGPEDMFALIKYAERIRTSETRFWLNETRFWLNENLL